MGKIPEGWLPYAPIGNQVPGTRFIAFKVPLREAFVDKLKADDRFTINLLLDRVPDLGLVIDLTHTTKYYNKREFLDRGVDYVKIPTPGQTVPPQHLVERFFEAVDYFLDTHKNDNTIIGVHCTHGVNRTGYMLCRYLIQRLGYNFNEAVEAVGRARGHMIERSPYLASLQANRDAVKKKPNTMRGIEESKSKIQKKEEVPPKKEEISRRTAGKDGYRGDYRTSPSRIQIAPSGRTTHRMRSRTPPLQPPSRGRTSPIQVRGRTPPMQPIRGRPSPPRYDRPMTGQHRDRAQLPLMRDRMPPPMPRGHSPPPRRPGSPMQHSIRIRTPSPPMLMLYHSPPHMRGRSPPRQMRSRTPPNIMHGRSPPRLQSRTRSPPPEMMGRMLPTGLRGRSPTAHFRGRSPSHLRGGSPPGRLRSRSPQYRAGRSPPRHNRARSPVRGRSPGRPIRERTPPIYGRPSSPVRDPMPRPPISPSAHVHPSRRDQILPGRGRSPPPIRTRSPAMVSRRERTPPSIQAPRRAPSPDFRRNEPIIDRHYSTRPGYEDNRRAVENHPRDYNERYQSSQTYSNERGYGGSSEYFPERYEKPRRERSLSPRRNSSFYPNQREEINVRPEYSPPRETKRRRKSPPAAEVREKVRRSSPPSGYMNSREGFKKDKREYTSAEWDYLKDKEGPDCREILNEKRSMRDVYPDSHHAAHSEIPKYAPSNADLREALEEEKRRRHGHPEPSSYHGQGMIMDNKNIEQQGYPSHGYQFRPKNEAEVGRPRQDYGVGAPNYDAAIVRSDSQRHPGYQGPNPYVEPVNVLKHQPEGDFTKSREEEFRKPRGRRGKNRIFDRLSRGGGRGRGGGGFWP